jgi:hypothetical protein
MLGGFATNALLDNGTSGDVTPGDRIYSLSAAVGAGTTAGTKVLPVTVRDAQGRSTTANIVVEVQGASTNPSGSGTATPSQVAAGSGTLLAVTVVRGANPTSTGIAVSGNLTAIGGAAAQPFSDNGTNGDATAGDDVFSFFATVPAGTATGSKSIPVRISDAQARSVTASISLVVTPTATSPSGTGSATPNPATAGGATLLTVTAMRGASPTSTGLTVIGNLTSLGGVAAQVFFDNGTNGDATAGDLVFSWLASIPSDVSAGAKNLPITIADAQARQAMTLLTLSVVTGTTPTASAGIVINEFRTRGPRGGNDEFVEIRNLSAASTDLAGWQLVGSNGSGLTDVRATIGSVTLPAGCRYLFTNSNANGYSGTVGGNQPYSAGITDDGGVALRDSTGQIVDQVGLSAGSAFKEGTPLNGFGLANTDRSYARNGIDSDDNTADFALITPGTPQNMSSCLDDPAPLDSDADGLPNSWETRFGLSPASGSGGHGPSGDPDRDGVTNLAEYRAQTHPLGLFTRYFAEGATSDFFDTSFALVNLSETTSANVQLRFQADGGVTMTHEISIGPRTRATVKVKEIAGMAAAEFSTIIESDQPFVADRTMTWDGTGYGSHAETSIASPSTTWYLAEGATHSGFDLFYLIQNPNHQAANVHITYLLPSGAPLQKDYVVAARSRFNVWVDADDPRLDSTDVSAVITSDLPTIVERAMYLSSAGRAFNAGHESAGVTAAATEWFLAEGATGDFFDLFVLLANPSSASAQVRAEFLLPGGGTITKNYTVEAHTRFTIWADIEDSALANTAVSTMITSLNAVPIVAERSMWWPGSAWVEAHNSAGLTSTGKTWALAEGEVGGSRSFETYVLIANRGAADTATVTLLYEDGTNESKEIVLDANGRTNVVIATEFPNAIGKRFAAIVDAARSDAAIVVERAMYSNAGGVVWAAGTNAVGTKLQ